MAAEHSTPESVWDYPRPPVIRASHEQVVVELGGIVIAETRSALRVLETSHPPGYYLPSDAFLPGVLVPVAGTTWCEYKGTATYYDLVLGATAAREAVRSVRAGWGYAEPMRGFESLRGYVSVYPGRVDRCLVEDEVVRAQEGTFYGGWITDRVVGPFKGAPGTLGW